MRAILTAAQWFRLYLAYKRVGRGDWGVDATAIKEALEDAEFQGDHLRVYISYPQSFLERFEAEFSRKYTPSEEDEDDAE